MIEIFGMEINKLDLWSLVWFVFLWVGYSLYADYKKESNLVKVMHKYRIQWMKHMVKRADRLIDVRIIETLIQTTTFLASTSILIIIGLVAALGYGEKASTIMQYIPFAEHTNVYMWVIKIMLLLAIFVYSFFKFTWVIRQFNYSIVLMVAAPLYKEDGKEHNESDLDKGARYINRIATMVTNAGRHFNMAVRSYYFGLVALGWFINPLLFMGLSVMVIAVLYRREFMSKTLTLLE